MDALQRVAWAGTPFRYGDCFRLTKGRHTAVCQLWSHQLGWELRLDAAGEFLRSEVCRSEEDVYSTFEAWKAALIDKGWSAARHPN